MRYYFDIFDGDHWARDDMGADYAHDRGALFQAGLSLTELARELLPFDGPEKELTVRVRLNDAVAFSVRLTFDTSFGPALTDASVLG